MKIENFVDDGSGVAYAKRPHHDGWKKFTKEGHWWVSRPPIEPEDILANDWEQARAVLGGVE